MVAMLVGDRIVHQPDSATFKGSVEVGVPLDGHHPTAIQAGGESRLFWHIPNGLVDVPSLDGIVIDHSPGDTDAASDGRLVGIVAVWTEFVPWIGTEQNQHEWPFGIGRR